MRRKHRTKKIKGYWAQDWDYRDFELITDLEIILDVKKD